MKKQNASLASKDKMGRLLVGAAVGVGDKEGISRVKCLKKMGVDIIVIDTAHGHTQSVIETLKNKKNYPELPVIVKISTSEAANELIKNGADSLKVGIGPGSICTRVVAGGNAPTSCNCWNIKIAKKSKIPIIADGGIKYSGDLAKAIAFGAML